MRGEKGGEARFGPRRFPEIDYGETLVVPTPAQGGDGKAVHDFRQELRSGMRGSTGTMSTQEDAIEHHRVEDLTTK